MLIKRRCTATGVVNFFTKQEPFIAIGSVISRTGAEPFVWRYHGDMVAAGGTARDWRDVERAIDTHHRRAEAEQDQARCAA